ncbi:DUF7574 domain-containing protein [Brevibacterium album]|uniref:DUF7574 domain-containing protein n=1 Tax=Brevibacterium album TaxID=417948 RepID=UPI00048DC542|nr:hypothetical protein [Brevibacterium album]
MALESIEGTDDWIEVIMEEDDSLCYEWDEFRAFYSPSEGVYYYASASGCSCWWYWDDFTSASDFQVGDLSQVVDSLQGWNRGRNGGAKTSLGTPVEIKRAVRELIQSA